MKKNKYKSGSKYGREFEDKFDSWCRDAGIHFFKDETMTNNKIRKKDILCDRCLIVNGKEVYVELKTTGTKSLDYRLGKDGVNFKWHQIVKADWLIMEFRPNKAIAVKKWDFLNWAKDQSKHSINHKDALSIGFEVEGMEWIYELEI